MPYLAALEGLLRSVPGAQGALLLDAEGEVVVEAGARDQRHRLIGAYQGITLASVQRASERQQTGAVRLVVCRHAAGCIILRTLKDGYYLVVSLDAEASLARGLYHSSLAQERLDDDL